MTNIEYSLAGPSDLPAIQSLLADCRLPPGGIELILEHCLAAKIDSRLIGTVALEPYGRSALLRSLAVAPEFRGQSLGRCLCSKIISHARMRAVEHLYLLTTDAERYFAAQGYKSIERSEAPLPIQATFHFRSLCPKSAVCMMRDITGEAIHAGKESLRLRSDISGAHMWAVALKHTMLTYFMVESHSRFASHSHESEQITAVLTGELFFEVARVVHHVRSGEVIAIPSSVPHAVWTENLAATAMDAWSPPLEKYRSSETAQIGDRSRDPADRENDA